MKKRFVLTALNIIAPERIQNLVSESVSESVQMKMAAGGESVPFPDFASKQENSSQAEARILAFPKKRVFEMKDHELPLVGTPSTEELSQLSSTEFELWQKEMGKKHQTLAQDPHASYEKLAQVFIVKTMDQLGKQRTKLAKIQGVLLDKKSS